MRTGIAVEGRRGSRSRPRSSTVELQQPQAGNLIPGRRRSLERVCASTSDSVPREPLPARSRFGASSAVPRGAARRRLARRRPCRFCPMDAQGARLCSARPGKKKRAHASRRRQAPGEEPTSSSSAERRHELGRAPGRSAARPGRAPRSRRPSRPTRPTPQPARRCASRLSAPRERLADRDAAGEMPGKNRRDQRGPPRRRAPGAGLPTTGGAPPALEEPAGEAHRAPRPFGQRPGRAAAGREHDHRTGGDRGPRSRP